MIAGPEWRNGRRSGLKIRRPQGCEGSNPSSGTKFLISLFTGDVDCAQLRDPIRNRTRKQTAPHRGAGSAFVPVRPPGRAARPAQMPTGLPREARCGLLFRPRGRPPACHRRGRSPLNQPTCDHADGATLGHRDAKASRWPRRPVLRARSGTTAATETGAVSVSVGDRTNPRRYTPSPAGSRRYKHRSALCSACVPRAMEPPAPGRQSVPVAQKAGVKGKVRNNGSDRDRGRIRIRGR